MNVFISWSGDRSKRVAELLRDWTQVVIQAINPWVSSQDIASGSRWFEEISGQLSTVAQGIICLTAENKERPWILFEAGALANGLSRNHLHIFLVDLVETDVRMPLSYFNLTLPIKERVFHMLSSINAGIESKLSTLILRRSFDAHWPEFDTKFQNILKETSAESSPVPTRTNEDLLLEVLTSVRGINKQLMSKEDVNNHWVWDEIERDARHTSVVSSKDDKELATQAKLIEYKRVEKACGELIKDWIKACQTGARKWIMSDIQEMCEKQEPELAAEYVKRFQNTVWRIAQINGWPGA